MKRTDDNLSNNDSATQLDKNFSRLLKLTGKSNKPGRKFTESLIENALNELNQTDFEKSEARKVTIRPNWLKEAVGWAAMIAAAFGTGLVVVISVVLKMNFLLEIVVVLTMVFNWINHLGG